MSILNLLLCVFLILPSIKGQLLEGLLNFLTKEQLRDVRNVDQTKNTYDFIIVGAGTAGCVLANRLTENHNWNVLLLEAGPSEDVLMDIPVLANYLQFSHINWKYKSTPSDSYCLGMDDNQCLLPRGKVVGGSSVLNYMIYTRGHKEDYENWKKLGNTGWGYDDLLPYFKKIENFTIPEEYDEFYHGNQGYLSVRYPEFQSELSKIVIKSNLQAGFKYVDYNGLQQVGTSRLQVTIKDGIRASASRSYLYPVRNRKNLHVMTDVTVKKIIIENFEATGVECVTNNREFIMKANKEIISSAGAIDSPKLLMLSGIGPKKHLESLKIPLIKNLKVGHNLMDHVMLGGITFLINKPYTITRTKLLKTDSLSTYFNKHKGPLTLPGGMESLILLNLNDPFNPDAHPDFEYTFASGSLMSDPVLHKNFGVREDVFNAVFDPIKNEESFMAFPILQRPKSKGRVMLKNSNYKSDPYIFLNYFHSRDDLDLLIKGANFLINNITNQKGFQEIGTSLHDIRIPNCQNYEFLSYEYWNCTTRHFSFTNFHQSGTCKMGPLNDKSAVVDSRLRVYGIKGLRVVDASIMPEIPVGHTNGPTYIIAEKGSDIIKEDWDWI